MSNEKIKIALDQLRAGKPLLLRDEYREHEADIAFAAKFSTPELVNFCLKYGKGILCLALRPEDASRLEIAPITGRNRDHFGTPFGFPISLRDGSSGVTARARSDTLKAASNPNKTAKDFACPGHVMTLLGHPNGILGRYGHTDAILHLLRLAAIPGPGVLCEVLDDNGAIANREVLSHLSCEYDLPIVDIKMLTVLTAICL
jgi:3,4-dihydroxy 2-butanone 4-phosphate synthase/GTP cyclohydrolase II